MIYVAQGLTFEEVLDQILTRQNLEEQVETPAPQETKDEKQEEDVRYLYISKAHPGQFYCGNYTVVKVGDTRGTEVLVYPIGKAPTTIESVFNHFGRVDIKMHTNMAYLVDVSCLRTERIVSREIATDKIAYHIGDRVKSNLRTNKPFEGIITAFEGSRHAVCRPNGKTDRIRYTYKLGDLDLVK